MYNKWLIISLSIFFVLDFSSQGDLFLISANSSQKSHLSLIFPEFTLSDITAAIFTQVSHFSQWGPYIFCSATIALIELISTGLLLWIINTWHSDPVILCLLSYWYTYKRFKAFQTFIFRQETITIKNAAIWTIAHWPILGDFINCQIYLKHIK